MNQPVIEKIKRCTNCGKKNSIDYKHKKCLVGIGFAIIVGGLYILYKSNKNSNYESIDFQFNDELDFYNNETEEVLEINNYQEDLENTIKATTIANEIASDNSKIDSVNVNEKIINITFKTNSGKYRYNAYYDYDDGIKNYTLDRNGPHETANAPRIFIDKFNKKFLGE